MDGIFSGIGLFSDKKDSDKSAKSKAYTINLDEDLASIDDASSSLNANHSAPSQAHITDRNATMKTVSHASPPYSAATPHSGGNAGGINSAEDPSPSAVIGSKITFKGELSGDEDLLIQGTVEGSVTLKDNQLTVGKLGKVKANLSAKNIIVDGCVEGDLIAEGHICINASSIVKGNIIAQRVTLEDGAKFRGSIEMDTDTPVPKPAVMPASFTPKTE